MNDESKQRRQWFHRFSERGGFNICFTLAAAPFIFRLFHHSWGFDWFDTVVLGSVASILVGHLVIMPLVLLPIGMVLFAFHRAVCPGCGARSLVISPRIAERTSDPEVRRVYHLADCKRCRRHYHLLEDGTFHEQPGNA